MTNNFINRRDFLVRAGAAGLGLVVPMQAARAATNAVGPYGGPYWIMVHAGGGWDPLFLTDPKANAALNRVSQTVGTQNGITYSAMPVDPTALMGVAAANVSQYTPYLPSNDTFFGKWGSQVTVLNGINTGTNNHDTGTRNTWSGQDDSYPSLAALIASTYGANQPLAYISSGGYDATLDLVALSRISSTNLINQVARPNQWDSNNPNNTYQLPSAFDRINKAQSDRLARQQADTKMVRAQTSQGALLLARAGAGTLANVTFSNQSISLPGGLGDLQGFMGQTQLVLASFQAGVAIASSMSIGGFDTHSNHDQNQLLQMSKLMGGVDYLLSQLDIMGLRDKTYVVVSSEFGRGPMYNSMNGKDHWPVTSALVFGPNVPGGRVIGATDDKQQPLTIDPVSLQPSSTGTSLTPTLINKALRTLAGVGASPGAKEYPLPGPDLPLFG